MLSIEKRRDSSRYSRMAAGITIRSLCLPHRSLSRYDSRTQCLISRWQRRKMGFPKVGGSIQGPPLSDVKIVCEVVNRKYQAFFTDGNCRVVTREDECHQQKLWKESCLQMRIDKSRGIKCSDSLHPTRSQTTIVHHLVT